MGGPSSLWRAAAGAGVLAIATALWFLAREVPACGTPLAAPMLDFELATTRADLAALLDCAPRRVELDFQNVVDLGLFIWAYGAFVTAFALAAGVRPWLAAGLGAVMIAADVAETATLRQIAAAWPAVDGVPAVLMVASRLKFAAIGAAMLLAGASVWRAGPTPAARTVAALTVLGGVGAAATIAPGAGVAASAAVFIAWLAMTGYAAVNALRSPPPAPSSAGG